MKPSVVPIRCRGVAAALFVTAALWKGRRCTLVSAFSAVTVRHRRIYYPFAAHPRSGIAASSHDDNYDSSFSSFGLPGSAAALKAELLDVARVSDRGFRATDAQRRRVRDLLDDLHRVNPTAEPARDYYDSISRYDSGSSGGAPPSLSGKWTLVYTDAPDIVGLAPASPFNRLPLLPELGQIGQECRSPYITNVIEWKRPMWAPDSIGPRRLLQKVVTRARSSPSRPLTVQLDLVGLQLTLPLDDDGGDPSDRLLLEGRGPLTVPFGEFQVLYLDDVFRAVQTHQGYVAVNRRIRWNPADDDDDDDEKEWF